MLCPLRIVPPVLPRSITRTSPPDTSITACIRATASSSRQMWLLLSLPILMTSWFRLLDSTSWSPRKICSVRLLVDMLGSEVRYGVAGRWGGPDCRTAGWLQRGQTAPFNKGSVGNKLFVDSLCRRSAGDLTASQGAKSDQMSFDSLINSGMKCGRIVIILANFELARAERFAPSGDKISPSTSSSSKS